MNTVSSSAARKPHKRKSSAFLNLLVHCAAVLTVAVLVVIVGYILVMGVPNLKPELFAVEYNSENVSMLPSLVNTLLAVLLTLVIAVPLGVMAAIFLVEYTTRGNKFVKVVRVTAETLAGIPSIVYGLFGMLFFVTFLKWGLSLLSGCLTLAIMVLPTIMRTTEEALRAVPDSYREGSFGLGAGRLRTVLSVVLPPAMPGILGGIILFDRPHRRRVCCADLHGGNGCCHSHGRVRFRPHDVRAYVCAFVRRPSYRRNLCNGRRLADHCGSHQRIGLVCCEAHHEGLERNLT